MHDYRRDRDTLRITFFPSKYSIKKPEAIIIPRREELFGSTELIFILILFDIILN